MVRKQSFDVTVGHACLNAMGSEKNEI